VAALLSAQPAISERGAAWVQSIERGVGQALEKAAAKRPSIIERDAAPYLRTFGDQARKFAALALACEAAGRHAEAKTWARHAERAATNLARIESAVASTLLRIA
jgi:hypothetical protein